jgi:teichuronic acid biosynthesis glycosyltransferase TuaG
MGQKPLVSVIIPVFNGINYLEEAINSVFAQTYQDYEIIVVDDGSTDRTWDLIQKYNSRIRGLRKENGGTASALNFGIKHASGDFICWLSHDDLFMPDKLTRQIEFMAQNPHYALSYTDYIVIDAHGAELSRRICPWFERPQMLRQLFLTNHIHGCSTMIRKTVFARAGYFCEELKYTQDLEMWIRILRYFEIGKLSFFSMKGRSHELQDSRKTRNFYHEQIKMYEKVFADIQKHGWIFEDNPASKFKQYEEFNWFADSMVRNKLVKTRHAFFVPLKYYLKALPGGSVHDSLLVLKKLFSLILMRIKESCKSLVRKSKRNISLALKGLGLQAPVKQIISLSRFFTHYAWAKINPPFCPVCGKRSFKNFLVQPPYWVGYCRECGLGRTMPPRNPKRQRHKHEKIYCEEKFPERLQPHAPFSANSWRRGLQAVAEAGIHGGRLLYTGGGFGDFCKLAQQIGFAVQGVEIFRNFAPSGYEMFELNTSGEPTGPWSEKNAGFAVIACWSVLEHLARPADVLRIFSQLLAPDGILLLRTPDFSFASRKIDPGFLHDYLHRVYPLDLPRHYWHFSDISLTCMLEDLGFTMIRKIPSQVDEYTPDPDDDRSPTFAKMEELGLACEMTLLCRKLPEPQIEKVT